MKPTHRPLLLHPLFLASLVLLLVNDHYWKYEYHNAITGKLSDITGLIVLPLFLSALFPAWRWQAFIFSAVFFIWWKSPLSTGFINWVNVTTDWNIGRIVDPTDLFALLVLPLAWKIKAPTSVTPSLPLFRNLATTLSAVFTLTCLCATTCGKYLQTDEPIYISGDFRTRATIEDIIGSFREHNIYIYRDTVDFRKLVNNDLYTPAKDSTGTTYMAPVRDVYVRRVHPVPTFTIPQLIIGSDTLQEVRFYLEDNHRKFRRVRLESFRYNDGKSPDPYYHADHLVKQFRKPILNKLKEVLK